MNMRFVYTILLTTLSFTLYSSTFSSYSFSIALHDSIKGLKELKLYSFLYDCHESIVLQQQEINTQYLYWASKDITASGNYKILPSSNITMKAGKVITLKPGVTIYKGNKYLARIEACNNTCNEVFDYPKFFTPNGDGVNDYWNINELSLRGLKDVNIYIFDRYAKLLTVVHPLASGWDGTYNSIPLFSDDYWFRVTYINCAGSLKEFSAHFTLKR